MVPEEVQLGQRSKITKLAGFEYTKHFDYAVGGEVIALRSLNIRFGKLDLTEARTMPRAVSDMLPRSKLYQGDIVLGYVGSRLGNLAMIPEDDRFHLAPNVALIRPDKDTSSAYLIQFMLGPLYQSRLWALAGSTGQPALSMANIRRSKVWLPPLPEQWKIADILSTWDQAIEKTEALLANAQTQKRALMQQLLTGKRRFPAFEGQPWKEVRLGDICEPKQWTTIAAKNMTDEGFPVYGANGHIGWFDEYNHEQETIAVGCRGVCGSVHLTPPKSYITGNSMALDAVDPTKAIVRYLFQYLTYFGFRDIVSGSAQPQITGKAIKAYRLTLPPVGEQQIIANLLQAADDNVLFVEAAITKLRTEKKALMQQLLTGKRRVVV